MSAEVENVRVVARVRPLSSDEKQNGYRSILNVDTVNGCIRICDFPNPSRKIVPKSFNFDVVFGPDSKQMDVYNEIARPIVEKVLAGYNGTVLSYGQTGTGKTFTMEGISSEPELRGIIPNSFAHIFGHIAKSNDDTKFLVRVSYFEIYNEEIHDLLSKKPTVNLEIKERPDVGVYVKDLSTFIVNNADDMERIMQLGNRKRIVAATAMNSVSSRSHAIFSITVETSQAGVDGCQHVKMGRLHLVDLAGSERQSKTESVGQRLKEAAKINLSLSTLGNVISALVDGKSTHIPYRNSKLTRILQDSLGGNANTVMCATVGPADYNYEETISTLRYATRAKNIRNAPHINEDPKDALLRQFQKEIEALKKQLLEADMEETENATCSIDNEVEKLQQADLEDEVAVEEYTPSMPATSEQDVELSKARIESEDLRKKLENLKKKILIGGENLLEKAEYQESLLEKAAEELEKRKLKEELIRRQIQQKETEKLDTEERYSSLQEEDIALKKKITKAFAALQAAQEELADVGHENQREMESLLENSRQLNKELGYLEAIEKLFIPKEYSELIEKCANWNEDINEWELKCVAYTGNNMKKNLPSFDVQTEIPPPDLSNVYLMYSTSSRPKTSSRKGKSIR